MAKPRQPCVRLAGLRWLGLLGELHKPSKGLRRQHEGRTLRLLAVPHGNNASAGKVQGSLYTLATIAAVRRLDPLGAISCHGVPFRSSWIMATEAACDSDSACS